MKNLLLFLTFVLITFSCRKPEKLIGKTNYSTKDSSAGQLIDVSESNSDFDTVRFTILGDQYTFPFKTSIIQQAWNELHPGNTISNLQATHNYIKFTPTSLDELIEIENSGLHVFDFPLDYEITQYGNVLEGTTETSIPMLYTFAPVNADLPDVSYEVIFTVFFVDMETDLAKKAFDIAGLEHNFPDASIPQLPNNAITPFDYCPGEDNWAAKSWVAEPYNPDQGNYTGGINLQNTTTPNDVTNACNCDHNNDVAKPSGCVQVEETRFSPYWQGVRNVAVDFLGPFGQYQIMSTNDNGCFKSSHKLHYRIHNPFGPDVNMPVFMRVIFRSGHTLVRSALPASMLTTLMPYTFIETVGSGGLHYIQVNIHRSTGQWLLSTASYAAATINNSYYEIADMCGVDNFDGPPNGTHFLIHPYNNAGATFMLHKLIASGQPKTAYTLNLVYATFAGAAPVIGTGTMAYLQACPPDLAIGYNFGGWSDFESDQMRYLIYHELGHSLHYRKTSNQFWLDLINYEAARSVASSGADPYGDGTHSGAGRCAIAEAWAEHIGTTYLNRRYGTNHSHGTSPMTDSWYAYLEQVRGGPIGTNFDWSWIPYGLMHDLMDNNGTNVTTYGIGEEPSINSSTTFGDVVGGFSNGMLYHELGSGTQNLQDFRDNVKNNQLSAQAILAKHMITLCLLMDCSARITSKC